MPAPPLPPAVLRLRLELSLAEHRLVRLRAIMRRHRGRLMWLRKTVRQLRVKVRELEQRKES